MRSKSGKQGKGSKTDGQLIGLNDNTLKQSFEDTFLLAVICGWKKAHVKINSVRLKWTKCYNFPLN